jgi:predicted porin
MKEHWGQEGETGSRMSGRALKNHQAKEETMSLNRKAMVLAVGAALAAPGAYAQVTSKAGSDWEFYGKFYPELTHMSGKNATKTGTTVSSLSGSTSATGVSGFVNRTEMQVSNSYIGFRGGKDLGGGLRGIWQLESAVAIDQGDGDPLANRDTFAGLSGSFGTIRLGNMDTPFKKAGDELGFLGISSGNFVTTSNVMRKVGFNNNSASSFNLRRANAIDFASPKFFGGLTYGVQYSIGNPDEAGTLTANPPRNPRVVSMALKYEAGPFYFAAAHETHFDMFGGSNQFRAASATLNADGTISTSAASALRNTEDPAVNSKDTAVQLTAEYKIGGHTIEVDYIRKEYKENSGNSGVAGRFENAKNDAWMVVWEARWSSQWRTTAHYIKADAGTCTRSLGTACTTTGLEATQISAGVAYFLDPNFYLFALYSVIDNGVGARYENLESGRPATGEDITQYAVGLTYIF